MPKNEVNTPKEVVEFIESSKKAAENVVKDVFPKKIVELENLYQSMTVAKLSEVHADLNIPVPDPALYMNDTDEPQTKKRKTEYQEVNNQGTLTGSKVLVLPNGSAPCNKHILRLSDKMKPLIKDLIEHANQIKMWISFLIPKIEDGNNFGVSIQEDTMAEARQVESEAATYLEQISRYYITRAKIVSKVAKYPHVEDYRQAVKELDEKEYVCLRLTCCELRNHYASLHDIIHKNIDKIKKPRNANAENLY